MVNDEGRERGEKHKESERERGQRGRNGEFLEPNEEEDRESERTERVAQQKKWGGRQFVLAITHTSPFKLKSRVF